MLFQTIAQSAKTKATQGEVILWVGILAALALLGGILIVWVRKRTLSKSNDANAVSLMDNLRDMLAKGVITQAEFDATRRAMVKKISSASKAQSADQPRPQPSQPRAEHRPQTRPASPDQRPPAPQDPDQSA